MADLKSPEHPLELLPAMLNLVLIQTGKILRDPESRGPKAIGLSKSKVNEFVPAANGRFHDALDEIEIKILDAKAVIERDLSAMRRKRAVREGVKVPSIAPSPIEDPIVQEEQLGENAKTQLELDLPMIDADGEVPQMQIQDATDDNQPQGSLEASEALTLLGEQVMPQDTTDSAGLAISIPSEANVEAKEGENLDGNAAAGDESKTEDIMASNNEVGQPAGDATSTDFDFDSMFNDTDLTAVDGGMEFDVDFSTAGQDASAGQDILTDNAFDNIALTGTNPTGAVPAENQDITGLLDDVFNQAGATANDNAEAGTTQADGTKAAQSTSQDPTTQLAATGAAPSEFDDLFGTDTFDLGGNDEVIGGDGNLADFDFDEEWLKM